MDTLSEAENGPWVSISQAVLWISARSISHWVCSSTRGNWIAWLAASGVPNGLRSFAYATDSLTQYWAAPRLDAACRIRFSLKKCCTTCSPRPSPPKTAVSGTRTSRRVTRAWSVGMLNVQRYSSTVKPGESTGVRNAVIPSAPQGSREAGAQESARPGEARPRAVRPLLERAGPWRAAGPAQRSPAAPALPRLHRAAPRNTRPAVPSPGGPGNAENGAKPDA